MGVMTFEAALALAHRKYDPNEPRDDQGQWTTGGGGGGRGGAGDPAAGGGSRSHSSAGDFAVDDLAQSLDDDVSYNEINQLPRTHHHPGGVTFASPSINDKDFSTATSDLQGPRQQVFEKAGRDVDHELGLPGSTSGVVGAWADGAENSTMLETGESDPEMLRHSAAMKGWLGQQKAVLVFSQGAGGGRSGTGPHALYDMEVPDKPAAAHAALLKAGIPFHTLVEAGNGTRALVVDTDGSLGKSVGDFAAAHGITATRTLGHAEFIGDDKGTGSDAEQRDRARAEYERVIAASNSPRYQGRTAGQVFQGVRDRWGAAVRSQKRLLTFDQARRLIVKLAGSESLYVHRPLSNAARLHDWATRRGFTNIVPADQMHVTQVYSRKPVDLEPRTDTVTAAGDRRAIAPLGDKGAVVLHFQSPALQDRHQEAMQAGASHDWPAFLTHVTLSYGGGQPDLAAIDPPTFPLEFGPEVHAPINDNWAQENGLRKMIGATFAKVLKRLDA